METLKIERYFLDEPNADVIKKDFTIIGLVKASPKYDKGKKLSADYYDDKAQTDLVVRKVFDDEIVDDKMVGVNIQIQYIDIEDNVALTKDFFKPLNISEVATLKRKRRQRAIDYLRASSVGTPIETYVEKILKFYKDKIELFIQGATKDFQNAITQETNEQIKPLLDIVVSQDGRTVKDSILYQIT